MNKSCQHGYTLVEILIASTIFVAVIGVGVATFNTASGFRSKTKSTQAVNQAARVGLETMARDIRLADGWGTFDNVSGQIPSTSQKQTVYGFGFLNGDSFNKIMTGSGEISSNRLVVFKQSTDCSWTVSGVKKYAVQRIIYYTVMNATGSGEILRQKMNYIDPDESDPTNQPKCENKGSDANLLSESVELKPGSLVFSGTYPRRAADGSYAGLLQQPYATIKMQVQTVQYAAAENGAHRAILELQTTIVPRVSGFKY